MSSTDDDDWREDPDPDPPDLGPDVPSVDIPSVDTATPDSLTPGEDVDSKTYRTFWRLVIVFDVALLALSLGPMFIFFEGNWDLGGPLFVLGLGTFGYGVAQYRRFRQHSDANTNTDETTNESSDRNG